MNAAQARQVAAIKEGTVIDHITAGHALKIVRFLRLPDHKKIVTVGLNLPSRLMGHKDLIKVEGRELTPDEVNQVALLAPEASINIIRQYRVTKKFRVELPATIDGFVVCPNPKCITNHESMATSFAVKRYGKTFKLRCSYCEKFFLEEEIKEYNL